MAETDKWVSVSDLSRLTGKDRATVIRKLAAIEPKPGAKNAKLYEKELAIQLILASREAVEDSQAKERKLLAEAEKAELVVRKLKGELVEVSAMKTAAAELIKTLYARTVRVAPSILAPKLVSKENAIDIENIIRTELADIYEELRTMPDTFLTVAREPEPDTEPEEDTE